MQLWEFILPVKGNDGRSYKAAHLAWTEHLISLYGGCTRASVQGEWVDDTECIYHDHSIAYRVLCDAEPSLARAWELFPDQKALYLAKIGKGNIHTRNP